MKKLAIVPVEIEIKFRNEPSEILDCEAFGKVCLDISVLMRKIEKEIKIISKKHDVSLSSEVFFRLEK